MTKDIEQLLDVFPKGLRNYVSDPDNLIEIVLDLNRPFELRYTDRFERFPDAIISRVELSHIAQHVSKFGPDNRAGIDGTLHRISRIVNRMGDLVGLTCRVGKPFYGSADLLQDLIDSGSSILILGRPGVGKTTKLRDMARYMADTAEKRVVIVDTSNEIAGEGDYPHPAVGSARRLQVPIGKDQAEIMIEAVENHMPEVIVIDEISTQAEAFAARTIAQRGVQLVATAHGRVFSDLMKNPPLWSLLGGLDTVTLSDATAKQRDCPKTIQERKMEPTFDILIELDGFERAYIYRDVAGTVDALLQECEVTPEIRLIEEDSVCIEERFSIRKPKPLNIPEKDFSGSRFRAKGQQYKSGKDTRSHRRR